MVMPVYSNSARGLGCSAASPRGFFDLRRRVAAAKSHGRPAGVPTTLVCTFPAFNDLNSREHRGKHTTTTTTGVGRLQEREQRRRQNRDFCRSVCVCVCVQLETKIPTTQAYLFFASTQLPIKHTPSHKQHTTQQLRAVL
jgi:hypothetical protein